MTEPHTLKTVLSEANTNILLNPDFSDVFQNRPSLLLSKLGTSAPSAKLMLATFQMKFECQLTELQKRAKKGTGLARNDLKGRS
jgi:hypothetical protein